MQQLEEEAVLENEAINYTWIYWDGQELEGDRQACTGGSWNERSEMQF